MEKRSGQRGTAPHNSASIRGHAPVQARHMSEHEQPDHRRAGGRRATRAASGSTLRTCTCRRTRHQEHRGTERDASLQSLQAGPVSTDRTGRGALGRVATNAGDRGIARPGFVQSGWRSRSGAHRNPAVEPRPWAGSAANRGRCRGMADGRPADHGAPPAPCDPLSRLPWRGAAHLSSLQLARLQRRADPPALHCPRARFHPAASRRIMAACAASRASSS